jgi:hypothetical protein
MAVENAPRERFGYDQNNDQRVSFGERMRDMFDGGGRGRPGERFEGGGLLSDIGNALGGPGGFSRGNDNGGGFISPGGLLGSAVGGAFLGPFGGLLGGLLGRQMGRGQQAVPTPDSGAASMMAPATAPRPTMPTMPTMRPPQPVGMDGMPALMADQIRMMREMGIDVAGMEGEPATHSELAALLRSPGALLSMDNPQVGRMYAPQNPGATIQPDGSSMPRYDVPMTSGVNMGQFDIGTVRPPPPAPLMQGFSPVMDTRPPPPAPPMQGFSPLMDISAPPPAPPGMATPPNAGVAAANQEYLEMLRRAIERGNPIRPAASILPR